MVHAEVRQNPATSYPWDGHVKRLVDLNEDVVRQFVERDREHHRIAERDPREAWHLAFEEKLFFRAGAPRLGEPLYRDPLEAERGWTRVSAGRGTGHLGTGLYFFGTLKAASRKGMDGVWVVDLSSVPDKQILTPGRDLTHDLHDLGNALGSWPSYHARAIEAAEEQLAVARALWDARRALREAEGGEHDRFWDKQYELEAELKEAKARFRDAERDLERAYRRIEKGSLRERVDFFFAERERLEYDSGESVHVAAAERDLRYVLRAKLPPTAAYAVRRYEEDIENRRFPGYRPMTYYMRRNGFAAVVHRDWREFNSGVIGNIWYPEVA